jgi:uncharacterized protein
VSAAGVISLDQLSEQLMVGGYSTVDADNDLVAEICGETAGRLVPFFTGNPHAAPDRYADVAVKFSGLELSPAVHGVAFTAPANVALVEIAARHSQPVYTVPVARPGCGAPDLAKLAGEFPSVTFVLGHCGYLGIDLYSIKAIEDAANIVAETSGCYTAIAGIAVERLGAGRVLFGTDYPMQHPAVELAKMAALDLDQASRERVMGQNAVRLLGEHT